MTHLSLFSGIGGLDLAAHAAGFATRLLCEKDTHCQTVLRRHFPTVPIIEDVREVTGDLVRAACGGRPTVVSAGFPCQPFSSAGKRKGVSDDRFLWPEVVRVLRESEPEWFVGENVRGLLSIDSGRTFGGILADLADLGYRVGWSCFGADEAAGASHRRDRVFIVGYLDDAVGSRRQPERSGADTMLGSGECMSWARRSELADSSLDHGRSGVGGAEAGIGTAGLGRRRLASRDGMFPPGPGDLYRWRGIAVSDPSLLPALSREAETELEVRAVAHGFPGALAGLTRRQRLKMLGNAVVPAQAFYVFDEIAAIASQERAA